MPMWFVSLIRHDVENSCSRRGGDLEDDLEIIGLTIEYDIY